jgi:Zn-dependent protease
LNRVIPALASSLALLQLMFVYGIIINLVLATFNLIPIPPLDGSHVVKHLLPPKWAFNYQRIGRYGLVILIVLLTFGRPVIDLWMSPVLGLFETAQRHLAPYIIASRWTG